MDSARKKMEKMSDIERAELSKQLDDDLDRFIDNFAKQKNLNKPKKPFVYDEWCKEIEQHPAFMTSLEPDDNGEFSEAIQALQALKYDDDELEDRRAAAERHKIDGNKHFKCKKYHWAINRYTDGINQRCTDRLLNSILYANRAAAQKRIGNIGSAFRDCFFARKFDPENMKAIIRGAECLVELGRGKQCIDWLKSTKENHEEGVFIPYNHGHKSDFKYFNELYEKAQELVLVEERNERKRRRNVEKDLMAKQRLLLAFKERNIDFRPTICFDDPELFEWSQIDVQLSWLKESEAVYLDDSGVLHWPILAQYPQIGKVDLVTDCSEESSVRDIFGSVFQQQASDNSDSMFNCNNVRYFVSLDVDKEYNSAELMPWLRIRDIFSISGFTVVQGLPTVQIYTKEYAEANFVKIEDYFYKTK